jgi:nucleoid-associated protein EbfC
VFPKGLGGLGDMAGMMKQAMQMKAKIEEMKEQMAQEVIEASAGGGMVQVTMNGKFEVIGVKIDPEVINADDTEMLESLVQAAFNDGVQRAQEAYKNRISEVTGGIDIPGLTS